MLRPDESWPNVAFMRETGPMTAAYAWGHTLVRAWCRHLARERFDGSEARAYAAMLQRMPLPEDMFAVLQASC